jgi:hypothetical protein
MSSALILRTCCSMAVSLSDACRILGLYIAALPLEGAGENRKKSVLADLRFGSKGPEFQTRKYAKSATYRTRRSIGFARALNSKVAEILLVSLALARSTKRRGVAASFSASSLSGMPSTSMNSVTLGARLAI